MFDLIIRGASVIDGSGSPAFPADVGIAGDKIVVVGSLTEASAAEVVDAAGLVVAPGFIDMHSHADYTLPVLPTADSKVHQGITLEVVGNCGQSPAPLNERTHRAALARTSRGGTNMAWPGMPWTWRSFGDWLAWLDALHTSVNVASFVGHGTIRDLVMGMVEGPPSPAQLAEMQTHTRNAMREGAFGLSTGLIYPPGVYADAAEIGSLAEITADMGGIYATHIRGEAHTVLGAIGEAIAIGGRAGLPVQISHLKASGRGNWPKMVQVIDMIDLARAQGQDVTADMYPYTAGNTYIGALFPAWAHVGGADALMARLRDPSARSLIRAALAGPGMATDPSWDGIYISYCPARPEYDGRTLREVAALRNQDPEDAALDLALEVDDQAEMIVFLMSEDNVELGLGRSWVMVGTDGEGRSAAGQLAAGKPNPRNFGTFARVLGHYTRERRLFSLEEAVHRMTGLSAARLGLTGRGLLRPGYFADLVIFDASTVADVATFAEPHRYPAGIDWVLVNGTVVISHGQHTGARPGRVLRH
jgi:N-acyl-D-amino-acid deacylase